MPEEIIPTEPTPSQLLTPSTAAPAEIIQQQASSQYYVVLRYAVFGLILAIALSLVGVVTLIWGNKEVPDGVIAMGSAAVGALSTMLARQPLSGPPR